MKAHTLLTFTSFFIPLYFTQNADTCTGQAAITEENWLCQDYFVPQSGLAENLDCNCNRRGDGETDISTVISVHWDNGPLCQQTCFCEPSRALFDHYCSQTSLWTDDSNQCEQENISFMADWSETTRIVTSVQQDSCSSSDCTLIAQTSCDAWGCQGIYDPDECSIAAKKIKTVAASATSSMVLSTSSTTLPYGCIYDDNTLKINTDSSTTVLASADNNVYCNCNGARSFTEDNSGSCNLVQSTSWGIDDVNEANAELYCRLNNCLAYGKRNDGVWAAYKVDENPSVQLNSIPTNTDSGSCFKLSVTDSLPDDFQEADVGELCVDKTGTLDDGVSLKNCLDIDNSDDCFAAGADAPFLHFKHLPDSNFMNGCVWESNQFGFREGIPSKGTKANTDNQVAICKCPSYIIPDDRDCLLKNTNPSDASTDVNAMYWVKLDSISDDFDKTAIVDWFDEAVTTRTNVPWNVNDPLEIELEFINQKYDVYALKIEYFNDPSGLNNPWNENVDSSPIEQQVPRYVSLVYSPDLSGDTWTQSNCNQKEFITRSVIPSYNAWNFICNGIDVTARRVKLIFEKSTDTQSISIRQISLVAGVHTFTPTHNPTNIPTKEPTGNPTLHPTQEPSTNPTLAPSTDPTTSEPTNYPSLLPTQAPTVVRIDSMSDCGVEVFSTNLIRKYNASFSDIASEFIVGAFPMLNDFDAEIRTTCSSDPEEYAWCTEPWTIISTFRLSIGTGYTGFELWEEDDNQVKWNHISANMVWYDDEEVVETTTDPDGYTYAYAKDGDCYWPNGESTVPCDLLPLTEGSQSYAVRFEVTCQKRERDRRMKPFIVAWRDGTGVQYAMRPEVNYTLARMSFTSPPVGTDWSFSKLWQTFGYAFVSIFLIIFFVILIFCTSIFMESKRTDNFDFIVKTDDFRTDVKQAMRYMPKSVFSDELQPLKEMGQKQKRDESMIHCYAVYKGKVRDNVDKSISYVLDLFSTHTNDLNFYIGQIRLYKNENFDPQARDINQRDQYSCQLDSWELQDTPPAGLRFKAYLAKIGITHHKEHHENFRKIDFDAVGKMLKECQQKANSEYKSHGDDDTPFWVEFRDTWKIHAFEYKPMRSRLDGERAVFWSGRDIQKHCKTIAIRERAHFAGKRHCPYIVIVVLARIAYMAFFSIAFFIAAFFYINADQKTTLDDYPRFGRERDDQIFNMSAQIDQWYETYNNDPAGNSTPAGDQLLQEEFLRQRCLTDFSTLYTDAINDAMEENTAKMDAEAAERDAKFRFPQNEYLAVWQASEQTCKLGQGLFPDPPESMEFLVKCEESPLVPATGDMASKGLMGISYSECSLRCYQWSFDPQYVPISDYTIGGTTYTRPAEYYADEDGYRKKCSYTTYYYESQCCDLHLIDEDAEIDETTIGTIQSDNSYTDLHGNTEQCGDAASRKQTGTSRTVYEYDNVGTSNTYQVRETNRRIVMSYIEVKFCSYGNSAVNLQGNNLWVEGSGVGSGCASDGVADGTFQIYATDLTANGPSIDPQVRNFVENSDSVAGWNMKTENLQDSGGDVNKVQLPAETIPSNCKFLDWGWSNPTSLLRTGSETPVLFNAITGMSYGYDDPAGEDRLGTIDLEWSTQESNAGVFDLHLNFQMECSDCSTWDEVCKWNANTDSDPSYCFDPNEAFPNFQSCLTEGPIVNNGENVEQQYRCYERSNFFNCGNSCNSNLERSLDSSPANAVTLEACAASCSSDFQCKSIGWQADSTDTDLDGNTVLVGDCYLYLYTSSGGVATSTTANMIWQVSSTVCEKNEQFWELEEARDMTCQGNYNDDSRSPQTPWGFREPLGDASVDACEDQCFHHGDSRDDICHYFTMMDLDGGLQACVLHLLTGATGCNPVALYYSYTDSYDDANRPQGSALTAILNRTTATIPQFQSADHPCSTSGASYQMDDITEAVDCTEADFGSGGNCATGSMTVYYRVVPPGETGRDYFELLNNNCGGSDTPWCVGFSYKEGDDPHYYRYQSMPNPAFNPDSTESGYCVETVKAPKFYTPEEMPAVREQEAAQANEEREESIDYMQGSYNNLLNSLLFPSNESLQSGFALQFNNEANEEPYGFGTAQYNIAFTNQDGADTGAIDYLMPFNCPGCPSSFDVPDYFSSDTISDWTQDGSIPDEGNYTVANNVVVPDLQVDFIEVPDLWGWAWNVDLPEFMNLGLFFFIVFSLDTLLFIYRVWYTSAIAAQLVRGIDVYIAPKYLRDEDADIEEAICCDGETWADMFLSCFLYIHDKIFNMHYYCWRICPYLLLLCNLGMLVAFLIVCYYLISQMIDLDTIAGMGIFSAMTVALGTQKLIRNEVLSYQAFYANNYNAPTLTADINIAIGDQLYRQFQYNSDEYQRISDYNANLNDAYDAFTVPMELDQDMFYDLSSQYYPWVSSNPGDNQQTARRIVDKRADNYGWKPLLTDVGVPSLHPTLMPTESPEETLSPTMEPTKVPTGNPTEEVAPSTSPSSAPTAPVEPLAEPYDNDGNFIESWTGFQINLRPQYLLGVEFNGTSPYWRISNAKVQFVYECDPQNLSAIYSEVGAESLSYTIDFLADTSDGDNVWEWQSFSKEWSGKTMTWEDGLCANGGKSTCETCAKSYIAHPVRAIRVTFPDSTQFGSDFDSWLGYYVQEFTVDGYVASDDVNAVAEYVTYSSIYIEPEPYQNETCPNGVTPIFGYFFRGFSRNQWNSDLKEGHRPYVDALRNIMLSPFVILLVLTCIYIVARLFQFLIEFVLIRADMLRENPYTKVPLCEYTDRWVVLGLEPDHPDDEPRSKLLIYPEPYTFIIKEKKRGFHKWKKQDERNFHVRIYDESKEIVHSLHVKQAKNRTYTCRVMVPDEGVYWVEVLYYGMPVGQAWEIECLRSGHRDMPKGFQVKHIWHDINVSHLDLIDQAEHDVGLTSALDRVMQKEDDMQADIDEIAMNTIMVDTDDEEDSLEKRGPYYGTGGPGVKSFEGGEGTHPAEVEMQMVSENSPPEFHSPPVPHTSGTGEAIVPSSGEDSDPNDFPESGVEPMYVHEISGADGYQDQNDVYPTYSPDANEYAYENQRMNVGDSGYANAVSSEELVPHGLPKPTY